MANKPFQNRQNISINPTEHNVPKMDRPSIAFAWFLDSMVIEAPPLGNDNDTTTYLSCTLCSERLCEVDDGDTLRDLLNTALAHDC